MTCLGVQRLFDKVTNAVASKVDFFDAFSAAFDGYPVNEEIRSTSVGMLQNNELNPSDFTRRRSLAYNVVIPLGISPRSTVGPFLSS